MGEEQEGEDVREGTGAEEEGGGDAEGEGCVHAFADHVRGESRFFMSLLPRWLYEAMVRGCRPSARRYSTIAVFA